MLALQMLDPLTTSITVRTKINSRILEGIAEFKKKKIGLVLAEAKLIKN